MVPVFVPRGRHNVGGRKRAILLKLLRGLGDGLGEMLMLRTRMHGAEIDLAPFVSVECAVGGEHGQRRRELSPPGRI